MNDVAAVPSPTPALKTRYVLHERLGGGGQGEVWRAHDPQRGVDIALKILHPAPGRRAAAWDTLVHEHASASRLEHPHILKVIAPEHAEGAFLLPMELAAGGDLRRLRGAHYLAVVPVLLEVAKALEHAHERGVIHRDLKPGNVLFDARGQVKVADFGVSGRAPDPGMDALIRGLSPFTASPEQLRGEPPTPADDVYGLGALAYELLSRYPPHYPHFDAQAVQQEPVPPLVPVEQIPPQLAVLISRMLAKNAKERPASMREVIEELGACLNATLTFDGETAQPHGEAPLGHASARLEELSVTRPPEAAPPAPPAVVSPRAEPAAPVRFVPPAPMSFVPPLRAEQAAPTRVDPPAPVRFEPPAPMRFAPRPARRPPARGAVDGEALWQEVRDAPLPPRVSGLQPMRTGVPPALIVIAGLAAVVGAALVWVPRHVRVPAPVLAPLATADSAAQPGPSEASGATGQQTQPGQRELGSDRTPAERAAPPVNDVQAPAEPQTGNAASADESYAAAAGEGFAAFGAGRLDEARAAFEKARALRPDGTEAADGLRRVNAAAGAGKALAAERAHALDLESQERWQDAARAYDSLLRQDRSLTFARDGKARAESRLDLDTALQAMIDRPDRLANSQQVRDEARTLLQQAREELSPGPVLSTQIARLAALLPDSGKPVHIALLSDSHTRVEIPSVGAFGTFWRRDLELRPGRYTVIGAREGYRDVRRDILVSPEGQSQPIMVICSQPM